MAPFPLALEESPRDHNQAPCAPSSLQRPGAGLFTMDHTAKSVSCVPTSEHPEVYSHRGVPSTAHTSEGLGQKAPPMVRK